MFGHFDRWSIFATTGILHVSSAQVDYQRNLCSPWHQTSLRSPRFTSPSPPSLPISLKTPPPPPGQVSRRPTGASVGLTRLAKAGSHSAKSTDTDTGGKSLEPGARRWQREYLRFPDCAHSEARWRRVCGGQWGSSIRPHGLRAESSRRLSRLSTMEDD